MHATPPIHKGGELAASVESMTLEKRSNTQPRIAQRDSDSPDTSTGKGGVEGLGWMSKLLGAHGAGFVHEGQDGENIDCRKYLVYPAMYRCWGEWLVGGRCQ